MELAQAHNSPDMERIKTRIEELQKEQTMLMRQAMVTTGSVNIVAYQF